MTKTVWTFGLVALLAACGGASRATHAPTSTAKPTANTQRLKLPLFTAADDTACVRDFETLRTAEALYKTVNERYATLDQLLAEQFVQAPLIYFTSIKIGTPAGGYTLVAAKDGPCASLPVRD
jgi:hypothetical protein